MEELVAGVDDGEGLGMPGDEFSEGGVIDFTSDFGDVWIGL